MSYLPILCFVLAVVFLIFFPAILSKILDPINVRTIRKRLQSMGFTDVEVKAWPNHYGVKCVKNGQNHCLKCVVMGHKVEWKGKEPEEC